MGRIKKLASETAVYGISSIVGRMIGFLLFPFYSHMLSVTEFGVYSIVYVSLAFLNVVYQYGMESAYLKFASVSTDPDTKQQTFSTAIWSLLGTSVALSLLLLVCQKPAGQLMGLEADGWLFLLYYMAGILVLDTLTVVPFAELRLQNKPWQFAGIRFTNILVNVGLNVVLIVGFDRGVEAIFIANVAASATNVVLLLPVYAKLLRPRFGRGLWRELLAFGLPFLPGGLGYALTERVNNYFLINLPQEKVLDLYGAVMPAEEQAACLAEASVCGSYVVGLFGAAVKLGVFLALVVQMFRYAWQPFFLQHARDADAKALFARIFTLFTALTLFVFLAVSFFVEELVALPLPGGRTLINPNFWAGLYIVPVVLLGYLFLGWYYHFAAGAYIEKQTRYFVHCTLASSVCTLLLNAWLVPRYGLPAAAWATTLSYLLMAALLWGFVRRFYPVPYAWRNVAGLVVWAAVLFAGWWYGGTAVQVWWAELGLLVVYAGGVLATGMLPVKRFFSARRGENR